MIIVFLIIFYVISFFMYLLIVGGNQNKSEYEKEQEKTEEIQYIKDYNKRLEEKKLNGRKVIKNNTISRFAKSKTK